MSFWEFAKFTISDFSVFLTVVMTLSVAFVNGWTDAPNAIASCVVTGTVGIRQAVLLASVSDFCGSLVMGVFSSKVIKTVINIADFGSDGKLALVSLCAAMSAVVIWATAAWAFGIPTSESHALIAGLTGASVAVSGGFGGIDLSECAKVFYGLILSTAMGFIFGFLFSKLIIYIFKNIKKSKADRLFKHSQIASAVLMAFMHGAQDSQKFAAVLMLVLSASGKVSTEKSPLWALILCSLIIALGTATGGGRIIKSVGMDMIKLRKDQGFASDLSGAVCLFISTLFGLPVSTTHTKTSAVMGVGVARSPKSVDWSVAGEIISAWIFTFPGCCLLSWGIACIYLKVF